MVDWLGGFSVFGRGRSRLEYESEEEEEEQLISLYVVVKSHIPIDILARQSTLSWPSRVWHSSSGL